MVQQDTARMGRERSKNEALFPTYYKLNILFMYNFMNFETSNASRMIHILHTPSLIINKYIRAATQAPTKRYCILLNQCLANSIQYTALWCLINDC